MTQTLEDMIAGLPLDQQREVEAEAARLIEEEMTLRELRKAQPDSKSASPKRCIFPRTAYRASKRSDFLLSSARSYVEAMGGKLRFVVEFPDRKPVTLSDLGSLTAARGRAAKPQVDGEHSKFSNPSRFM